jgi:hypothetical protein
VTVGGTSTIVASFAPASSGYYEVTATTDLVLLTANGACWLAVGQDSRGSGRSYVSQTKPVSDAYLPGSEPPYRQVPVTTTGLVYVPVRQGGTIDEFCVASGSEAAAFTANMTAVRVNSVIKVASPRKSPANVFHLPKMRRPSKGS